jgi:hypothetical protein
MQQQGIGYTDLANQSIQSRRARVMVPCGAGGTLTDDVPFYFAPRSPMLYAIHQGNVPTYFEGQESVVYLVSTVEAVRQANLSFAFTDGHVIMALTQCFDDPADLNQVDWQVMTLKYWFGTPKDNDLLWNAARTQATTASRVSGASILPLAAHYRDWCDASLGQSRGGEVFTDGNPSTRSHPTAAWVRLREPRDDDYAGVLFEELARGRGGSPSQHR